MNKHGFTLVELLIVLVVMTLVFGVGYANYRDYSRNQQFVASLRMMEGDIRVAQNMASSGVKSTCEKLKGYRFLVDTNNKQYSIVPVCEDGSVGTLVKTETLGSDVETVSTSGGSSILFYVLGRGTDIDRAIYPDGFFSITLTQVSTAKQGILTITDGGKVSYIIN